MNSLSWLMYAADVVGNLRGALAFALVVSIGCAILSLLASVIFFESFSSDVPAKVADDRRKRSEARKVSMRCAIAAVILTVPLVFLPRASTIYLIAASEAGEAVVTSDTGAQILQDLQTIIRQRIESELGPKPDRR